MNEKTAQPNKRAKKQVNTRLPGYILDLLDLIAETTGMTKTQILTNAIDQYAEKIRREYIDD